ncbi:MAG: hypothetical protein ACE5KM_06810 [Planctomycetaceae bacterium]
MGFRSALLSTMFVVTAPGALAAAEWKQVKTRDFKADLPGTFKHVARNVKSAVGNIKLEIYQVSTKKGLFFAVMHSDYPPSVVKQKGTARVLDDARDGAIRNIRGKLDGESKIQLGKHHGREFRFSATRGGIKLHGAWRLLIVNNRLYQLGIVSPFQRPDKKDVDRFFSSFQLLK